MRYIFIILLSTLLLNGCGKKMLAYEIGFVSLHNNQTAIWLTKIGKLGKNKLVEEVDINSQPVISPDSKKIAFVCLDKDQKKNIYIINIDGSGKKQLVTDGGEHPSWSPDGKKIAYSNKEGIWVISIDNLYSKQLIETKYPNEVEANVEIDIGYHPKWSPDGKKIAFKNILNKEVAISIIDADGKNRRWIQGGNGTDFDWSPDSSKIVIASDSSYWGRPDEIGLWVSKIDFPPGTRQWDIDSKELITKIIKTDSTQTNLCSCPKWSPDGKKIIFIMGNVESKGIFCINPDGSNLTKLIDNLEDIKHLIWHPNGKKIACVINKDGKEKIYIMSCDGKKMRKLTNIFSQEYYPFWLKGH